MSYADTLLASGEVILRRERQHWFILVYNARFAILGLLLALVLFLLRANMSSDGVIGFFGTLMGWLALILLVGGIIWGLWSILRWQAQEYVITNRRLIDASGVINKVSIDSNLEKVNDAVLTHGWAGRVFGFGDLDVLTASETGISKLRMLRDATDFKKAMLEAKYDLERGMAAGPAGPPLRTAGGAPDAAAGAGAATAATAAPATAAAAAPAAPAAPAAAAPAVPAAPAPAASDPDEVTRTLANLADLRDRGAISPAEYEAKKAELLGRL